MRAIFKVRHTLIRHFIPDCAEFFLQLSKGCAFCSNKISSAVNFSFRIKSGRLSRVRLTEAINRYVSIFSWLPERSSSGTDCPLKSLGLVYCGCFSRFLLKVSFVAESAQPRTPGNKRVIESITTMAASSPPVRIKSPMEISSSTYSIRNRSSTPSYRPHTRIRCFSRQAPRQLSGYSSDPAG